jgi:hypothetical protein
LPLQVLLLHAIKCLARLLVHHHLGLDESNKLITLERQRLVRDILVGVNDEKSFLIRSRHGDQVHVHFSLCRRERLLRRAIKGARPLNFVGERRDDAHPHARGHVLAVLVRAGVCLDKDKNRAKRLDLV